MIYNYPRNDMNMALEYFKQKKVPNFVDVVSYNPLLKIHLCTATTNYTRGFDEAMVLGRSWRLNQAFTMVETIRKAEHPSVHVPHPGLPPESLARAGNHAV